jgi:hypothetical protein
MYLPDYRKPAGVSFGGQKPVIGELVGGRDHLLLAG